MTIANAAPPRTETIAAIEARMDPEAFAAEWAALEKAGGSPYQTRRWVLPWYAACASPRSVEPLVILARSAQGEPLALLPMAVRSRLGARIATWAGDRHSNANLPILSPRGGINPAAMRRLLEEGGAQARVDAFELLNQPLAWDGCENPCAALPSRPSSSALHSTPLEPDLASFHAARISPKLRKRARWRQRKLEEFGEVAVRRADTPETFEPVLAAFIEQKRQRLRERSMGQFDFVEAEAFYRALACAPDPGMEFYALLAGERIVAVYAGIRHRGRFSCMINSISLDPEIARASPGDMLITALLERLVNEGVEEFDLGIGDAAYKDDWCERAEPLVDALVAVTMRGRAYCALAGARLTAKRLVKGNARLTGLARRAMGVFSR
jgi:CelD/BcsL family acetyltransferase involved in cellulose biosynthesis